MRRFTSGQQILVDVSSSCSDDSEELMKLLGPMHFNKGALKHEELPEIPVLAKLSKSNVSVLANCCKLVPPIKEGCFTPDEMNFLNNAFRFYFGDSYIKTFMLHTRSSAIQCYGELHGAVNSLHSSSSLVCAKKNCEDTCGTPGFVKKYCRASIVLTQSEGIQVQEEIFLACIDWLEEHDKKSWFGYPVVWQKYLTSESVYCIPMSNVLCRCAYINDDVTFNDRTYKETVTIVIPLNNFAGL